MSSQSYSSQNRWRRIRANRRRTSLASISQIAGLHTIPAIIRDIPDQAAAAMSLIENIQREDLNPLEEAIAMSRLIADFGLTHQQTAESVGRSQSGS